MVKRQIKGSAKAKKSAARLTAVQAMYQMQQSGIDSETAINDYTRYRMGIEEEGALLIAADTQLLDKILTGVQQRHGDIEPVVNAALKDKNPLDKQELLIKCLLCCGAFELLDHADIDAGIIINDYVDVAKSFYGGKEPAFINAVLDKIAKVIRA